MIPFLTALALALAAPPDDDLGTYPLDDFGRTVPVKGKMQCPDVPRQDYRGVTLHWSSPLSVHAAFATRLARFEALLAELATRFYGRPPSKIRHLGSFNCRRIARYPDLLSEHGLANAIDVSGFDFPALDRPAAKTSTLPKPLRRAFRVTVLGDWNAAATDAPANSSAAAIHAAFLRALTDALTARADIFRVLLGPAYPGHKDHFHFDMAPYRLIVL